MSEGSVILEVTANIDDASWKMIQSPFMQENVRTTDFRHEITVGNGKLSYLETTIIEIYEKILYILIKMS